MSDDDVRPDPEDTRPSSPLRSRTVSLATVLTGLCLLALVAAVGLALQQRSRADDLDQDLEDRRSVTAAAARFGEVYLSYDFGSPDGAGDAVLELVTPEFAADFEANRAPGIEELFTNLGTTTQARTDEVYIGDLTDDTARALVVVDVVASSQATGTQELTGLSFVVTLLKTEDGWLVDGVLPPPQPDLAGDGVEETTTTTAPTTAPTTAVAP